MCLILLSYHQHPKYPVVIAANRDEFYERPTLPARFWPEDPKVLAGKDLQGGGTWLGISKKGRSAMITNYREPETFDPKAPTRGKLVSDFLCGSEPALKYLERIRSGASDYNGFNLILGDDSGIYYFSNRAADIKKMSTGLYGLSNALLDTPWPKVSKSKIALAAILNEPELNEEALFKILLDTERAQDERLPDTGVGTALEKILSPAFIKSPKYGTRCSTVVLIDSNSRVRFIERSYDPGSDRWKEVRYDFKWAGRL